MLLYSSVRKVDTLRTECEKPNFEFLFPPYMHSSVILSLSRTHATFQRR